MSDPSREGRFVGSAWKRKKAGDQFEVASREEIRNDSPKHPTRFSRQACIRKGTLVAERMIDSAPEKVERDEVRSGSSLSKKRKKRSPDEPGTGIGTVTGV